MTELHCCFLTLNCNCRPVDNSYLARCLTATLDRHDFQPDLIYITFQELAAAPDALLGGFMVAPYLDRIQATIDETSSRSTIGARIRYDHIATSHMNWVVGMLFALPNVAPNVSALETTQARLGEHAYGNKAAVAIRFQYSVAEGPSTSMTFVGAHFLHGEERCKERNRDWQTMNETLRFGGADESIGNGREQPSAEQEPLLGEQPPLSSSASLFRPGSYIFFGGDLNYRIAEQSPTTADDFASFPQPPDKSIASGKAPYLDWLETDQLQRERDSKRTLHGMTESDITFPPTYKFSAAAMDQVQAAIDEHNQDPTSGPALPLDEPPKWLWSTKRWPAWTDRILFSDLQSSLLEPFRPRVKAYTSLPIQPTSDHRPVVLLFTLPLLSRDLTADQLVVWPTTPFELRPQSSIPRVVREGANRAVEVGIGLQAWMALTWQGRVVGTSAVCAGFAWWYYNFMA